MKTIVLFLLFALGQPAVGAEARPKEPTSPCAGVMKGVKITGGDGHDRETAVVIKAANEHQGFEAERRWVACQYRDHHKVGQRLVGDAALFGGKGQIYDVVKIASADGQELELWFDITRYYGKW